MIEQRRRLLAEARLYLVSEGRLANGQPLATAVPTLASGGVDIVQLRDRTLSPAELEAEARACVEATRRHGVLFIVNDDPVLAQRCGADGVHLGQGDADAAVVAELRQQAPDLLIGRSTRGGAQLDAAADEGADYAAVGPVWETPTKPGRAAVGPGAVADAARRAQLPWFAIGGIDARRALRVGALGARRIAVVRAITSAADPAAAAQELRRRLDGSRARVLTIAGSDSGGGAGIQADIKAISAAGAFPMCAVTALTAQNTRGVTGAVATAPDFIRDQIAAVAGDLGIDAVKTGMLGNAETVRAVCDALDAVLDPADQVPVVVDTVLRAESGASLMDDDGERAIVELLLPRATVITPNLMEAQALAGLKEDDPGLLAATLHERHGCAVIVTGGHGASAADTLHDAAGPTQLPGERLPTPTTHGAGCTHSATLAALLGQGVPLRDAARLAKTAATGAVAGGLPFGDGAGPVHVMANLEAR